MVKKLILGIAVLGIVVLLIISLIGCFNIANNEKFMFENIRECEELCSLNYEGEKAVIYEIPQKDNYIKNLKYVEFFGVEYESSELEFKMFAYVFESDSEAKKYFENVCKTI